MVSVLSPTFSIISNVRRLMSSSQSVDNARL